MKVVHLNQKRYFSLMAELKKNYLQVDTDASRQPGGNVITYIKIKKMEFGAVMRGTEYAIEMQSDRGDYALSFPGFSPKDFYFTASLCFVMYVVMNIVSIDIPSLGYMSAVFLMSFMWSLDTMNRKSRMRNEIITLAYNQSEVVE
jgi:hypothetical protein